MMPPKRRQWSSSTSSASSKRPVRCLEGSAKSTVVMVWPWREFYTSEKQACQSASAALGAASGASTGGIKQSMCSLQRKLKRMTSTNAREVGVVLQSLSED